MTPSSANSVARQRRDPKLLVLIGLVVLAFNLRPAAVSVGTVLSDITADLSMSGTQAGLLTSLPVLAFALFGATAPRVAVAIGIHKTTLAALVCVVTGLVVRSRVESVVPFLAFSLVALAGMATANVLLPSLVKWHFPHRVGFITAIYSTSLAIGLTSASILTVPISQSFGGWRIGLVAWAIFAAIAILPWIALLREDRPVRGSTARHIGLGQIARTRLGWLMAGFFGLQALQAYSIFGWFAEVYRSAGFSAQTAGLLLGIITGVSIPMSFLIPSLAARLTNQMPIVVALVACYPLGYLGLILAPAAAAVLWAILVGVAASTFPLVLTLIGLRARTAEGTAGLSGFTQSVGYVIASIGPFGVGLLYELTGGWTVPLSVLLALAVPLLLCGLAVSKPSYIEDQLPA